jgi:hypothetical protein
MMKKSDIIEIIKKYHCKDFEKLEEWQKSDLWYRTVEVEYWEHKQITKRQYETWKNPF